jgi:hypothetical protein
MLAPVHPWHIGCNDIVNTLARDRVSMATLPTRAERK